MRSIQVFSQNGASPRPTLARPARTEDSRASRQAGMITAASAVPIPISSAITITTTVCRVASGIVTIRLMTAQVMISATITAKTETTIASSDSRRRIVDVVAPRTLSSDCSRRRRSPPVALTAKVRMMARIAPGRPRKRKRTRAYSASSLTASSRAARLSPTIALPATRASKLFASRWTYTYASRGSGGSRV